MRPNVRFDGGEEKALKNAENARSCGAGRKALGGFRPIGSCIASGDLSGGDRDHRFLQELNARR
jgi:hypothetical protein